LGVPAIWQKKEIAPHQLRVGLAVLSLEMDSIGTYPLPRGKQGKLEVPEHDRKLAISKKYGAFPLRVLGLRTRFKRDINPRERRCDWGNELYI
jgi:hypothetical protein